MKYTVDYFISKFEAIPEERWTIDDYIDSDGKCCALGLCGERNDKSTPAEAKALVLMFADHGLVPLVNDGCDPCYQQPTPKQRILAALYDIKKAQDEDEITTTVEPKPADSTIAGEFIPVTYKAMELVSAN